MLGCFLNQRTRMTFLNNTEVEIDNFLNQILGLRLACRFGRMPRICQIKIKGVGLAGHHSINIGLIKCR